MLNLIFSSIIKKFNKILYFKENIKFENYRTINFFKIINPLTSPGEGAPTLNYGYVNTVTPSPGEVKGLIIFNIIIQSKSNYFFIYKVRCNFF